MKTTLQDSVSSLLLITRQTGLLTALPGRALTLFMSVFTVLLTTHCKAPREVVDGGNLITSFSLVGPQVIQTTIDDQTSQIEITVPYGTLLQQLRADIILSPSANVVPTGDFRQDFTKTVLYTVTSSGGVKKVYKVIVKIQAQNSPVVTKLSTDSLRAGQTFIVMGQDFGKFNAGVKVTIQDASNPPVSAPSILLDSTRIQVTVPLLTEPGKFNVSVSRNNIASIKTLPILVKIPAPEISAIRQKNLLQGDSLVIGGSFITAGKYKYSLSLGASGKTQVLQPVKAENGKLVFKTSAALPPNTYELILSNDSESVSSLVAADKIRIYDALMPFVSGIKNPAASYAPTQSIAFQTVSFDKLPARFYQIRFFSDKVSYNVGGIYGRDQLLSCSLPANIINGTYNISVLLLSETGELVYDINLDEHIIIKQ